MPLTPDQIEREVLDLPPEVRARLVHALMESLEGDAEFERAWNEEIEHRIEDLRSGRVQGIPAEEVFAKGRALLK